MLVSLQCDAIALTLHYHACCCCIPIVVVWLLFYMLLSTATHHCYCLFITCLYCSATCFCPQLYCCPLSPVYYWGCCHHLLCSGSCCSYHCSTTLFFFCWAWQWDSCRQNHCTGILSARPLPKSLPCCCRSHRHAVAEASTSPRWCQSFYIATLVPKLLHRHAGAKAAALPCCCQSCCIAMLYCHAIATTFNVLLPWCSCWHGALLCCCRRFMGTVVVNCPAFASCTEMFVVATG